MYKRCRVCARAFGENLAIPHMPVGRRLAFDAGRGRLWIVCARCGEWNLTGLEERWEAVQECERLFRDAPVRVSSGHVGMARIKGVRLIQAGQALPDELANWRYGTRLRDRGRRAAAGLAAAGVLSTGGIGGSLWAGLLSSALWSPLLVLGVVSSIPLFVALWNAAYATPEAVPLSHASGERRPARPRRAPRPRRPLPNTIYRVQDESAGLHVVVADSDAHYGGDDALAILQDVLPRLNWRGGGPEEVQAAVRLVDRAEARAAATGGSAPRQPAWQSIADGCWTGQPLSQVSFVPRLALEMALTEEVERRVFAGEALTLVPPWQEAEEVAGIADSLLVPASVTEWLARHRRRRSTVAEPTAVHVPVAIAAGERVAVASAAPLPVVAGAEPAVFAADQAGSFVSGEPVPGVAEPRDDDPQPEPPKVGGVTKPLRVWPPRN